MAIIIICAALRTDLGTSAEVSNRFLMIDQVEADPPIYKCHDQAGGSSHQLAGSEYHSLLQRNGIRSRGPETRLTKAHADGQLKFENILKVERGKLLEGMYI